ncbi:hypothetical protein F5148DRAFT_1145371 [Russula earlei]|uniref:Uncharacterized protein n=1 Tax=Russula earlei TaxID=71964 RepID=A0ACC0UNV6_9AGAM|nr:hypothetical protein F5148DRAFT_1145371 [Russula earlei]
MDNGIQLSAPGRAVVGIMEAFPRLSVERLRPFHFEDSLVVMQASHNVEEETYKVHRYFLTRESVFFKDLFSLPQSGDPTSVEGLDDTNPIKLSDTPKVEFENLLRFFYFGMHDDYKATLADWIAMLSISTRLIFEKVRERAIKEITARLDEVEAFELIGLAIKYDVEQWLKPAYRRIVTRSTLISHSEALKVPFPMAVMLMRSREQYWRNPRNTFPASGTGNWGVVDTILNSEIRLMEVASVESRRGENESTSTASSIQRVDARIGPRGVISDHDYHRFGPVQASYDSVSVTG